MPDLVVLHEPVQGHIDVGSGSQIDKIRGRENPSATIPADPVCDFLCIREHDLQPLYSKIIALNNLTFNLYIRPFYCNNYNILVVIYGCFVTGEAF
jgi:hypothetical protein